MVCARSKSVKHGENEVKLSAIFSFKTHPSAIFHIASEYTVLYLETKASCCWSTLLRFKIGFWLCSRCHFSKPATFLGLGVGVQLEI